MLLVILAALLAASQASADPSPSIAAKQAEAQQVIAEINQLNVSLDRSNELVNLANLKLAHVKHDIAVNRRELAVAKRNLARSRASIAKRLVTLYTAGSTSTLEVILGGHTLGEILNRIDTANRVSTVDAQVATQVQRFQASVLRAAQRARDRAGAGAAARRPACGAAAGDRGAARRAAIAPDLAERGGRAPDRRAAGRRS